MNIRNVIVLLLGFLSGGYLPAQAQAPVRAQVWAFTVCENVRVAVPDVHITIQGGGGVIKGYTLDDGWTPPLGAVDPGGNYIITATHGNVIYGPAEVQLEYGTAYVFIHHAGC